MWTFRISKYIYSWFCITKEDKLRLPLQAKYNSRVPCGRTSYRAPKIFFVCVNKSCPEIIIKQSFSCSTESRKNDFTQKCFDFSHWSFLDIWMKIRCIRNWFCLTTKSKIRYLTILKINVTIVYEINLAQNLYNAYNYTSLSHAIIFLGYHVDMVLPQRAQDRTKPMISKSPNKKIFYMFEWQFISKW